MHQQGHGSDPARCHRDGQPGRMIEACRLDQPGRADEQDEKDQPGHQTKRMARSAGWLAQNCCEHRNNQGEHRPEQARPSRREVGRRAVAKESGQGLQPAHIWRLRDRPGGLMADSEAEIRE